MKKLILIMVILMLILSSCNSADPTVTENATPTVTETSVTETNTTEATATTSSKLPANIGDDFSSAIGIGDYTTQDVLIEDYKKLRENLDEYKYNEAFLHLLDSMEFFIPFDGYIITISHYGYRKPEGNAYLQVYIRGAEGENVTGMNFYYHISNTPAAEEILYGIFNSMPKKTVKTKDGKVTVVINEEPYKFVDYVEERGTYFVKYFAEINGVITEISYIVKDPESFDLLTAISESEAFSLQDHIAEKYVFLMLPSENISNTVMQDFVNAREYGFYGLIIGKVFADLVDNTRKGILDNSEELKYEYSTCLCKDNSKKECGTHYSIYDTYESDSEKVAYLHGTDLICYFRNYNSAWKGDVVITQSEAKEKADAFVSSILSEKVFSEFVCVSVNEDTSGTFAYNVSYSRLTNGFETDENITVYLDGFGSVVKYKGYNVGKYDNLKEQFDEEKINAAKSSLVAKINSLNLKNTDIKKAIITANSVGKLFLRIDFSYEDEYGLILEETVLINIK